jgi:hypothetical protein
VSKDTDIEVLGQTPYNFQFLVSSASIDIVLVRALDVSWVKTIGLSARVHRTNIGGSSAKYEFLLFGVNPSPTDGQEFVTASLVTSSAINNGTSAPALVTWSTGAVYSDPAHPFVKLVLRATGPTIATPGNLYAELSASLSLRGP